MTIPGIENLSPAVKYVIAFAIIFVLLALFALILRRLTGSKMSMSNERGRARQPRLGIVDVYDLDRQRQLILLRRDNVEHLLLVGGPNDVVVETNIVRVAGARLPAPGAPEPVERFEPAPGRSGEVVPARPIVETQNGRPTDPAGPSAVGSMLGSSGAALEPMLKPTRVSAAPPPPPVAQTPRSPAPRFDTPRQPEGPEGGLTDMTRQLEAALRKPPTPDVPRPRPPEPPPQPVRQEAARLEPARQPPPRQEPPRQDAPRQDAPRQDAPKQDAPKQDASKQDAPKQDPARPDAPRQDGNRPEPSRREPPRPEPSRPEPPRQEASRVPPPAAMARPEPRPPAPALPATSPPPSRPDPVPPIVAKPSTPGPAAAGQKAPPAGPPAAGPKPDPFSIEDIEAEFARLLGRPLDKKS